MVLEHGTVTSSRRRFNTPKFSCNKSRECSHVASLTQQTLSPISVPKLEISSKFLSQIICSKELDQTRDSSPKVSTASTFYPTVTSSWVQVMVPSLRLTAKTWTSRESPRLWEPLHPFPSPPIQLTSSVVPPRLPSTGATPMTSHQSWEIPVTTNASTTSLSHLVSLSYSLLAVLTTLECGTQRPDKNYWELRFQASSVTAFSSRVMVKPSSLVGTMVRSELSCHNQEDSYMPSTMPTTTVLPLLLEPTTAKKLFLVVWKVKSESGELVDKLKSWRDLSRSTEVESLISRSTSKTLKLSHLHLMALASSGTSSTTPESCACSNQQCSNKSSITQTNPKSWLLVATERSLTGTAMMVKLLECSTDQRLERSTLWLLLRLENISFLAVRTRESNFGITMKVSATSKVLVTLETSLRSKFLQIKRPWSLLEPRELSSCGTCRTKFSSPNMIKICRDNKPERYEGRKNQISQNDMRHYI